MTRAISAKRHRETTCRNNLLSAEAALALVDEWNHRIEADKQGWQAALERAGITPGVFLQLRQFRARLQIAAQHGFPIFRGGMLNLPISEPPKTSPPRPLMVAPLVPPPPARNDPTPAARPNAERVSPAPEPSPNIRTVDQQMQVYAAVRYLHETHSVSLTDACTLLDISYQSFCIYRKKFLAYGLPSNSETLGIEYVDQKIGYDITAALERLRNPSGNGRNGTKTSEHTTVQSDCPPAGKSDAGTPADTTPNVPQATNIFDAIRNGEHAFEPSITDGFESTGAFPGTTEKVEVMKGRAHVGHPLFHPEDPACDIEKPRWLELKKALEDGMKK